MNFSINNLSEEYLPMVEAFSCVETAYQLNHVSAKIRRRILKHSQEMDSFLKEEALEEQSKGLNTTHLYIDEDSGKIVAYISLCNDSIHLECEEMDELQVPYTTIPAMKIARLAVSNEYVGQGIGKSLIQFAAFAAKKIREISGIVFLTLDCYEHRVSFYEEIGFIKNKIQEVNLLYDSPVSMRLCLENYLKQVWRTEGQEESN